jgi:hypothetical protein
VATNNGTKGAEKKTTILRSKHLHMGVCEKLVTDNMGLPRVVEKDGRPL